MRIEFQGDAPSCHVEDAQGKTGMRIRGRRLGKGGGNWGREAQGDLLWRHGLGPEVSGLGVVRHRKKR